MIVVDSSAIIAFLRNEPEAEAIEEHLESAPELQISSFNELECRVVLLRRFGERAVLELELLLARTGMVVAAFDSVQSELAYQAYRRYGKGGGHPAQLNLGDCAAYALASSLGAPLLFKGQDFVHTDIEPVLPLVRGRSD